MPGLAPPVADERQALREFLRYHQSAFFAVAFGLTDEQARSTPTVSALSIGGLIKHVTGVQRVWMKRIESAPEFPQADSRPRDEIMADYTDQHVMREDETLEELLAKFKAVNTESVRILDEAELDTVVPVPHDVPWFPKDIDAWSVRWVVLHVINELARHAGHADIIRESIDGATMYELLAAVEGWPETDFVKAWKPRPNSGGSKV
jgi:uncharacterized damage-inducible protein DinB